MKIPVYVLLHLFSPNRPLFIADININIDNNIDDGSGPLKCPI